jgi:Ser/Thr protein kinase RdoA (MazF antagonist)
VKTISTQPIAQGRTAEVYPWEDGHVLKLYRDWCPREWVHYEARIARAICEAGIPSPAAGDIIEIDGRQGIVYVRVEGISMLQDMNARPWTLLKHARSLADLHVKIHRQAIPGLPSYKDHLQYAVSTTEHLESGLKNKVLGLLQSLPAESSICHGDYHPGNVLLTKRGPVVIDWMTACSGSPWTDVARTSMILSIGAKAAGKQVRPLLRLVIRLYHDRYLHRYRDLMDEPQGELARWTPVIAAARLNENILPEREALIRIVKEGVPQ